MSEASERAPKRGIDASPSCLFHTSGLAMVGWLASGSYLAHLTQKESFSKGVFRINQKLVLAGEIGAALHFWNHR